MVNQSYMRLTRNRHYENLTYLGLWIMVISFNILGTIRSRSMADLTPLDENVITRMVLALLPFIALFIVHNWVLIPKLLFRNKLKSYFFFTFVSLIIVWGFQYLHFTHEVAIRPRPPYMPQGPQHLMPLPLFLDLVFSLLLIGSNLVIALLFQRFEDRLEKESLMKTNAEDQLNYLKAQINPHFYMNMLNNIHGMIEIDPEKAQDMVIDMSKLMRYMLYEGCRPHISLSSEIEFLENYLRLMRLRYPSEKVIITGDFPDASVTAGKMVAPLLFLVFIENAFKHGISFRDESYVSVSIELNEGNVCFNCLNSVHPTTTKHKPGIGLENVKRRLELIYGTSYTLKTESNQSSYSVNLTIPLNETSDSNNR